MLARIILFPFTIFLYNCSSAGGNVPSKEPTPQELKTEANDFALTIIQSFITKDSIYFKSILSDSIYSVEANGKPIAASKFNIHFSNMKYSNYTLDDYKKTYSYMVMTFDEYSNTGNWVDRLIYWKPDNEDYLFFGLSPKDGKQKWPRSDLFSFMVSKRSGKWRFRAR